MPDRTEPSTSVDQSSTWPHVSDASRAIGPVLGAYPAAPDEAVEVARAANEAIRVLNHATLHANDCPVLREPSDAYRLMAEMGQLASRLPQLLTQISAFLQRQLQHGLVTVEGGEYRGDPFGAVGTASHELEGPACRSARSLATSLEAGREAIAFAAGEGRKPPTP